MLPCQRPQFDIPKGLAYLDAAYMSPIPRIAAEAGRRGTDVKAAPWKMTIDAYYDELEEARALAAGFIGAGADDIAVIPATSYGIAVAAANVPVAAGSLILMMENEHTSHRYAWYELAAQRRAQVVMVPRSDGQSWADALVTAIETAAAPVSVVAGTLLHWFEGMTLDIEAVARAARAAGASLVMDGTQWVGAIPFDVTKVRPDFLSFATYKFLLGPYRLGFLYADKIWQEKGRPLEFHSWNRKGGERPEFYLETMPDYLAGARRFDMGERSDFAVLPVAITSMNLLQSWGSAAVFARLSHLTQLLWTQADLRGLTGPRSDQRAPHIAVMDLQGRYPATLGQSLKAAQIFVTLRGGKMRVSPHVYNDEADILRLFDQLDRLQV
jgi:selenocysteine lyase/cysteine desulfurase